LPLIFRGGAERKPEAVVRSFDFDFIALALGDAGDVFFRHNLPDQDAYFFIRINADGLDRFHDRDGAGKAPGIDLNHNFNLTLSLIIYALL
jgi:hypothetical protein